MVEKTKSFLHKLRFPAFISRWYSKWKHGESAITWNLFIHRRSVQFSLFCLVMFFLFALFPGFFAGEWAINTQERYQKPSLLQWPPSLDHPFGTDHLGRDMWIAFVRGTRISLFVGVLAAVIIMAIAIPLGAVAGYFGGKVDNLIMAITDIVLVIPAFFLVLIITSIYMGGVYNVYLIIMVIAFFSWPMALRMVRADFMAVKEQEYVMAARALGASRRRIMFKHILPNVLAPQIINASMVLALTVLLEASLAFLGFYDPNQVSWGRIISQSRDDVVLGYWWVAFFPGLGIALLVLSWNLIGNALRDVMDPRYRKG